MAWKWLRWEVMGTVCSDQLLISLRAMRNCTGSTDKKLLITSQLARMISLHSLKTMRRSINICQTCRKMGRGEARLNSQPLAWSSSSTILFTKSTTLAWHSQTTHGVLCLRFISVIIKASTITRWDYSMTRAQVCLFLLVMNLLSKRSLQLNRRLKQ